MSLISLKRFSTMIEAEVVRGKLEASGIPCVLQADPLPGAGSFVQGAELFVEKASLKEASQILSQV